ncbi:MAG TPA: Rieske (2Fe-2S) protein, partial [Paenalcaligenes sp.]|nr:Rieske (2Fe-2S) protein [Paenalcaligenes sp.]
MQTQTMAGAPDLCWYPVASSTDLPLRHVYQAQLLGHEFALWRADDGHVNLWENRCLHRGVRLSIGINDGRELKCQYHGWRYSNRTGGCTYIPAHPADAPARTVNIKTYPSIERYGLIWSAPADLKDDIDLPWLKEGELLTLRPIPINVPAETVLEKLKDYRFAPVSIDDVADSEVELVEADQRSLRFFSRHNGDSAVLVLFVQPVTDGRCVVRGLVNSAKSQQERRTILRQHNWLLSEARARIESELGAPLTPPMQVASSVVQFQPRPQSSSTKPAESSGATT